MKVKLENENTSAMKNCFITDKEIGLYGFYGLTYFELEVFNEEIITLSKEQLYALKACIDRMIAEIEK